MIISIRHQNLRQLDSNHVSLKKEIAQIISYQNTATNKDDQSKKYTNRN